MAAAGFLVEAEATFFKTVMTIYMIFDDRSAANTCFERLSRDMTGVAGPYRSFDLDLKGHPSFTMRCGYLTETNHSVNCHYKGPEDRVIGLLLFADGPPPEFTGEKSAIDLIFENEEAMKRIAAVTGASWAYLDDVYY